MDRESRNSNNGRFSVDPGVPRSEGEGQDALNLRRRAYTPASWPGGPRCEGQAGPSRRYYSEQPRAPRERSAEVLHCDRIAGEHPVQNVGQSRRRRSTERCLRTPVRSPHRRSPEMGRRCYREFGDRFGTRRARKRSRSSSEDSRVPNKNKAMMKAKILRRMTSQDDSDSNETSSSNKENVDTNKAAVVIQSHFRGYTARRKWAKGRAPPPPAHPAPAAPSLLQQFSVQERAAQLHTFADQVHDKNQELHKNLRRNKPGIRLHDVQRPPQEYRPPPGFTLVPAIVRGQPSQLEQDASRMSRLSHNQTNGNASSEERHLQTNQNWQNLPCSRQCGGLVSNKIIQLVRNAQKAEAPLRPVYNPTYDPESDLRKILRNSPEILATPVFSSDDDYNEGPFRFKQLLRPTLGPTESLRKRKVRNTSGQSPWMSDSSQDSVSSKQPLYNKRRPQISMGVYYNS